MQKGTVCGADRSVYKLIFFLGVLLFYVFSFDFIFNVSYMLTASLENLSEMFTLLITFMIAVFPASCIETKLKSSLFTLVI